MQVSFLLLSLNKLSKDSNLILDYMSDKALWVRAFLKCGLRCIFGLILTALISKMPSS
jgi:hypothetical protein